MKSSVKYLSFMPSSIVVAYLLFGSRWISYLKIGPFFITDVLILLALMFTFSNIVRRKRERLLFPAITSLWAICLFLAWVTLRYIFNFDLSFETLRDLAPYVYAFVGIIAAVDYVMSSSQTKKNTVALLYTSLSLHVLWVGLSKIANYKYDSVFIDFSKKVQYFGIRPDIDVALIGLFITITVIGAIHFKLNIGLKILAGVSLFFSSYIVCLFDTRAGFTTVFLTLAVGIYFSKMFSSRNASKTTNLFALSAYLLIILFGVIIASPKMTVFERITGAFTVIGDKTTDMDIEVSSIDSETLGVTNSSTGVFPDNGEGTTGARIAAWTNLTKWNISEPVRLIWGVGFGSNFMLDSGTTLELLGQINDKTLQVRSPHNFLLGTFTRLGLVGLFLFLIIFAFVAKQFVTISNQKQPKQLVLFALLIIISVAATSMLGVVFETPFGAIPFWWSIGIIAGEHSKISKHFNKTQYEFTSQN